MSKVQLQGNVSGTGIFTIASPNSNTDRVINLPDAAGTLQVSGNPISGTTGTFTGLLNISAAGAGQIQFPATQNASSNANTLDDYEEGTFTPDLVNNGGTSTWAVKIGRYVKIGAQINFWCYFDAGGPGSGGAMIFSNLPFTGSGTGSTMSTIGTIVTNLGASSTSWYPAFQSASTSTSVIWSGTGQVIGQSISFALIQGSYNAF